MVNIAILGAGNIAVKMAHTINGMVAAGNHNLAPYAVAARDEARAQQFAHDYGFQKAYGSYEEMLADPKVDLVYVATPHSHHYEHMRLCLSCGKNVLCEKAFTVNASQAGAITTMAREKGVYVAEAIWTRYLPSRKMIDELIASGAIGTPRVLTANLAYPLEHVERMLRPELAGGALLDLGVYTLNFASMVFGDDIAEMHSVSQKIETGVDAQDSITLTYRDGKMAILCAAFTCTGDRRGVVYGTTGTLTVDNINNPMEIIVTQHNKPDAVRTYTVPPQITGFEYEVQAAVDAIERGQTECEAMPHAETVRIMRQMDALRAQWGLVYPNEGL